MAHRMEAEPKSCAHNASGYFTAGLSKRKRGKKVDTLIQKRERERECSDMGGQIRLFSLRQVITKDLIILVSTNNN